MSILNNPQSLITKKVSGLTVLRKVYSTDASIWFEAQEDNGTKRILYVYETEAIRDEFIPTVRAFHTATDGTIEIDGSATQIFATIGDHRVLMPKVVKEFLKSPETMPSIVEGYVLDEPLGDGVKGVTFRVHRRDGPRTPYAMKLTIREEYQNTSYVVETSRMVDLALEDRDHFPELHDFGETMIEINGEENEFVFFVETFFKGSSLEDFLSEKPELITPSFLNLYVREMLAALAVMEGLDLMHDDLHNGNVMITETLVGVRPCLIDFGSMKRRGGTRKERDDIRNLASHLAQMINIISDRDVTRTAIEDQVLTACVSLHSKICDDDPLRRPDSPHAVLTEYDRSYERGEYVQKLLRPFDFGNAEEVMDNDLLYKLSAKTFPWKDKLEASSSLMVVGPRGCGKTTIFRSMSFACMADAGKIEEAIERSYLGLYISCNKEFRLKFSAIASEVLLRRNNDIRHYFNLLVLREFVQALEHCAKAGKLLEKDLNAFRKLLNEGYGREYGAVPGLSGSLSIIEGDITREIHAVRMNLWNDRDSEKLTDQGFVADLARCAAKDISPFHGKKLILLIDDYTERKVPKEAQSALNHILFIPNSVYSTKVSSEVFGVPQDDTFGAFLDQDRDYKEFNLGTLYFTNLPSNEQKEFLREIVNNRLSLSGYVGTAQDIIGESEYRISGTLARALKEEAEAKKQHRDAGGGDIPEYQIESNIDREKKRAHYHGWDTISDLCTGDISNILELLDRMYDANSVTKTSLERIPDYRQHRAIVAYSSQFIARIKGIPEHGEELFELVNAFGNMSARLLREYPWVGRGANRRDPYQVIRIELDEAFVYSVQQKYNLEDRTDTAAAARHRAEEFWRLMQRHCIFIDAHESRSRRNTLASKVILRRIFCPAFGMSLTNSECFTLSRDQWGAFCTDPSEYCKRYAEEAIKDAILRRSRGKGDEKPTQQGKLPLDFIGGKNE